MIKWISKNWWIPVLVIFILSFLPTLKDSDFFKAYLLIWATMGAVYVTINWVVQKYRIKKLMKENIHAELSMLKSQVNPHFFFNTLNNLYALSVEQSKDAPEMILKLSDVMRYTIYEGQKDRVLLKAELKCLEDYIALNRIRFKSLNVTFQHAQHEDQTRIAPLILLVPLENAFKHGIEKLGEEGYIKMSAVATEDTIAFSIENNYGPKGEQSQGGIGLENLRKRLALIYPGNFNLVIDDEEHIFRLRLTLHL